jgi:hypothetical protein
MKKLLIHALLLLIPALLLAEEGFTSQFHSLEGWRLVNFEEELDPTLFEPVEISGRQLLRVVADGSASMIIREDPIDVYETPYISWKWNLVSPLEDANLMNIFSEDTPIRILVTFRDELENLPWWLRVWARRQLEKHGELPPTSALNYVWSTQDHGEEPFKSMWSRRIQFIVKNSGEEELGTWQEHRVNVIEDYRRAMGTDPPAEAFIAVMSDADNTGGYAEAWVEYVRAYAE